MLKNNLFCLFFLLGCNKNPTINSETQNFLIFFNNEKQIKKYHFGTGQLDTIFHISNDSSYITAFDIINDTETLIAIRTPVSINNSKTDLLVKKKMNQNIIHTSLLNF